MNEVKNTGGLDFPYVLGGFAAYDPLTYLQLSMIVAGIEMAGIEPNWSEVLANSGIGPKKDVARALVEDGIEASITDFISKDETLPAWMRNKLIHLKGSALGRCTRKECRKPHHFESIDEAADFLRANFKRFEQEPFESGRFLGDFFRSYAATELKKITPGFPDQKKAA